MRCKRFKTIIVAAGTCALATLALVACGDKAATSSDSQSVASVGGSPITRTMINHWMSTLAGEDYFQLSARHTVPADLVSEPARYPICISRLEDAAARAPTKATAPSSVQLLTKCRQLYQALKLQAVAFLVKVAWVTGLAHDLDVSASPQEVVAFAKHRNSERFANETELREYLAKRRTSYKDELFNLKLDLLSQKVLAKLNTEGGSGARKLAEAEKRWTAKTNCRPGYVVQHCRQYTNQPEVAPGSPSASVLMEQVAALATGRCINRPACAKQ